MEMIIDNLNKFKDLGWLQSFQWFSLETIKIAERISDKFVTLFFKSMTQMPYWIFSTIFDIPIGRDYDGNQNAIKKISNGTYVDINGILLEFM